MGIAQWASDREFGTEPSPGAARPGEFRPARQSAGRIRRYDRRL